MKMIIIRSNCLGGYRALCPTGMEDRRWNLPMTPGNGPAIQEVASLPAGYCCTR
jgi:hypothetical protein